MLEYAKLLEAIDNKDMQKFEQLIAGKEIDARDSYNWTMLHFAAMDNKAKLARALIRNGADVNAKDEGGHTPLFFAVLCCHLNVLSVLLEVEALRQDPTTGSILFGNDNSILKKAVELNDHPLVTRLLTFPEVNSKVNEESGFDFILLHDAALRGHTQTVRALINGGADVHSKTKSGHTALHAAASLGKTETVNALLDLNADINVGLKEGAITPLHFAAKEGHAETVKALILRGADVNAKWNGETPLAVAANEGKLAVVKVLLDTPAVQQDKAQVGRDLASLHNRALWHAAGVGDLAMLNCLLAYPEVMNNVTAGNNTVLGVAKREGHQHIVDRLMQIDAVRDYVALAEEPQGRAIKSRKF